LATSGGVPIHPDRADRVRDQPSAVLTTQQRAKVRIQMVTRTTNQRQGLQHNSKRAAHRGKDGEDSRGNQEAIETEKKDGTRGRGHLDATSMDPQSRGKVEVGNTTGRGGVDQNAQGRDHPLKEPGIDNAMTGTTARGGMSRAGVTGRDHPDGWTKVRDGDSRWVGDDQLWQQDNDSNSRPHADIAVGSVTLCEIVGMWNAITVEEEGM